MTARSKTGSARRAVAPAVALAAAVALPFAGLALTFATPALAKEHASLAPTAPLTAAIAVSSIAEAAPLAEAEPAFETIATGVASYYGRELEGNRTASGERFNPSGLTAAHRTLPLGTIVRVTNKRTGDSVMVRINDRGPFHGNRLIDLSEAAAREVGLRAAGSGMVELAVETD